MVTEKIIRLKECWDEMWMVFNGIQKNNSRIVQELELYKSSFENHAPCYDQFVEELKANAKHYSPENLQAYMVAHLEEVAAWKGFELAKKTEVIKNNIHVEFCLTLMDTIDRYAQDITALIGYDEENQSSPELYRLINADQIAKYPDKRPCLQNPIREERFDIEQIRNRLKEMADPIERMALLHSKKYEFKVWQSEFDETYPQCSNDCQFYSEEFYPNFLTKCDLEIERNEDQIQLEKLKARTCSSNMDGTEVGEKIDDGLMWAGSQTDFLELCKALFLSNVIQRRDGVVLTQKEFFTRLGRFFDVEIKHSYKILNSAANRKRGVFPFLKGLHDVLVQYYQQK
ncbi:MAG: RteC domain-containing protein [Bacteroidota bacterium]|nr:RteC domain-containing protein [Bacteroidota bacterium]